MQRVSKILIISQLFLISIGTVFGQNQNQMKSIKTNSQWLIGVNVSTFGVGIEGNYLLTNKFHLRSILSYTNLSYPIEHLKADLKGDIHFKPSGLMLIVSYQLHDNIYFSLGSTFNFSKISLAGILKEPVLVGDIEMTPDEIGQVRAEIVPNNFISPYLGFRFGQSILPSKKILLNCDLGILFHGKPQVSLSANGMLTPTASEEQELIIEKNISPLSSYPIISFSISYII